jgi:O-acetylhomoserine/O-acetylserine sulfhydrylase-like pyridoxal-dependent enzyme
MSTDPSCWGLSTKSVHAGAAPCPATGARITPIYQTNGFVFDDLDHGADIFNLKRAGFSYSRGANPTTAALERRIAALEGGSGAIAVASGQSALLLIIATLCASGDRYVSANRIFGGSLSLSRRLDQRFGLGVDWADPTADAIEAAINASTRAILIESVINPTGEVVDLPGIARVAQRHRLPLVVDNTLATPALLRPIEHGAHIVWHSASKFLAGSGQAIGGLIVDGGLFDWAGDSRFPLISGPWAEYDDLVIPDVYPTTAFMTACRLIGLREFGPGMAATTAFLILMGAETLPLRMRRHCENAATLAAHLAGHGAVKAVSLPTLPSSPNHNLASSVCPDGLGSVFTVTLAGGEAAARRALDRLSLFSHLVNIGETRSLVSHPASTTHRTLTAAERIAFGIEPGTLRLSVGLEDIADLIADWDQALAA